MLQSVSLNTLSLQYAFKINREWRILRDFWIKAIHILLILSITSTGLGFTFVQYPIQENSPLNIAERLNSPRTYNQTNDISQDKITPNDRNKNTEQKGISNQNGDVTDIPEITPIGWGGNLDGTFRYTWSGMSGLQFWDSVDGNFQFTEAHTVFASVNVPHNSLIEVCSRGNLPYRQYDGGPPYAIARAGPNFSWGFDKDFQLGDWTCTQQNLDLRYTTNISIGHHYGSPGRHQPGIVILRCLQDTMIGRFG
jgi:hypothetical protein